MSSRLSLSACMIVLDEEAFLVGCLESLQGLVDDIVVMVDDRTTDASPEIARSHGARVFPFRFENSFSRARNLALDQVRNDWVLYVDADERLQALDRNILSKALGDQGTLGLRLLLRPRLGWTSMWLLRVFRKDPRIRFSGIVHGQVSSSISRLVSMKKGAVRDLPVSIEHLGYEGGLEKLKALERTGLYQAGLKSRPLDSYLWRNFGVNCLLTGDRTAAWRAWRKSLELIRGEIETDPAQALTYYDMIQNLMENGENPVELVEEMTLRFPDYPTTLWLRTRCLMRQGEFAEAVPLLQKLVKLGKTRGFDRALSYDSRIFDVFAYGSLGTCFFQARRFKKAEEYFKLALAETPGSMELRLKAELSSRKAVSLDSR